MNLPPRGTSNAGFSLIEVTLAIGIIAFAFVALFGLLPTGMQTFRASVDTTNAFCGAIRTVLLIGTTCQKHITDSRFPAETRRLGCNFALPANFMAQSPWRQDGGNPTHGSKRSVMSN